jgi:hypothetical protein
VTSISRKRERCERTLPGMLKRRNPSVFQSILDWIGAGRYEHLQSRAGRARPGRGAKTP